MTKVFTFTGSKGGVGTTVAAIRFAHMIKETGATVGLISTEDNYAYRMEANGLDLVEVARTTNTSGKIALGYYDDLDVVVVDTGTTVPALDRTADCAVLCVINSYHSLAAAIPKSEEYRFDVVLVGLTAQHTALGFDDCKRTLATLGARVVSLPHSTQTARALDAGLLSRYVGAEFKGLAKIVPSDIAV